MNHQDLIDALKVAKSARIYSRVYVNGHFESKLKRNESTEHVIQYLEARLHYVRGGFYNSYRGQIAA